MNSLNLHDNAVRMTEFSNFEWSLIEKFAPVIFYDSLEPFFPVKVGVAIYYRQHAVVSSENCFTGKLKAYHVNPIKKLVSFQPRSSVQKINAFFKTIGLNLLYSRPFSFWNFIYNRKHPLSLRICNGWKEFQRAFRVIEYAFYYHSDIEHVYDLEHVWVYLNAEDQPIAIYGSRHGMISKQYPTPNVIRFYKKTHPVLFADPGKHAFYISPRQMNKKVLIRQCSKKYAWGVFNDIQFFTLKLWKFILGHHPSDDSIHIYYAQNYRFFPSFTFNKWYMPTRQDLVPWATLERLIPELLVKYLARIA